MAEWLEADGAGGFASGTTDGIRTRRYHALLLTQSPVGRFVLVNGIEAWLMLDGARVPLSSQRYQPGVIDPDGATRIESFAPQPWPRWTFALPDGNRLVQEVFVAGGQTCLRWTREGGVAPATLHVRPLLSGRDYHALHHENPAFAFAAETGPAFHWVRWRPYPGLPPITAWGGTWTPEPLWFRRFLYTEERDRGLDDTEDLASPGILAWDLAQPATLALRADTAQAWPVKVLAEAVANERAAIPPLQQAARQYLAHVAGRATIIAGFPWFTDWGRDTFIALRGLLLAPEAPPETPRERLAQTARSQSRHDTAEAILLAWSAHVDQGMLPNRFPDGAGQPEYNAVDASLWFVIAAHDLLATPTAAEPAAKLQSACLAIVEGYASGTRYGIGVDTDGLLHANAPGVQLTWMDAKIGDWVVTPRSGKPVEVQALWINALRIVAAWSGDAGWDIAADRATHAFLDRFPDPASGGLLDLVDGDAAESTRVRPNQLFAAGGLPHRILPPEAARRMLDLVEGRLLTPLGLRTLDPADPAYRPRFEGDMRNRDSAYHQGTAWPWLLGPFVDAWLWAHGNTPEAKQQAKAQFLAPLHAQLDQGGLGHLPEVADGDDPHKPGGCPFQAWSLGELMRMEALLQ